MATHAHSMGAKRPHAHRPAIADPLYLARPILQDPDARLLDLARWHDVLQAALFANGYAEDLAHNAGDKQAIDQNEKERDAMFSDWRSLVEEVANTCPRSLRGLGLKTRVFAEEYADWWQATELGPDELAARSLLHQVLSLAGVSPPGRGTLVLGELVAGAPASPAEGHEVLRTSAERIDPVEAMGRRYVWLTDRHLALDAELTEGRATMAPDDVAAKERECEQTRDEFTAIEGMVRYARPTSLAGAMFQLVCAWADIDTLSSYLPDEERPQIEPIRRMMAATLDCLEDLAGADEPALGRDFAGPTAP